MWNPTTSSSDNKQNIKEVDVDDCNCSGNEPFEQPQQKNNSKNSQIQTSTFGAQLTGSSSENQEQGDNKKFESDLAGDETTDSGFISGPQTSSTEIDCKDEKGVVGGCGGGAIKKSYLSDSQQQNKLQEEEYEKPESGFVSGEMRLTNNVIEECEERISNLRLSGLNNLNVPKQTQQVSQQQQQQQQRSTQQKSSLQAVQQQSQTSTIPQQLTPASAWEKYYQQNDDGDTSLHLAVISGFVDVVAALIRLAPHPCLFNIQNDEAQTPLHLATLTAQPKIIRMLLLAGAEPTIRDRRGNTALHLACISGEEQCVKALNIPISASEINEAHRQYGHRANDKSYLNYAHLPSDLEIRNYDGERCVHLAAQAGFIDILRILVVYGADINAREGKSGRTPLHIAIECCNEDLVNYLLDDCQTLNLETATYAGLTAYQVACILNKSEMQNMLEKKGAERLTPPDSDYDSDIETDLDDSKFFGDRRYFVNYNGGNAMTVA